MLCVSLFLFRFCSVVMYLKRQILRGLDLSILFSEARIGNMTLKNRFVRSATWENMATEDGHMTEKLYDIYEELAKGEVG